jgi:hypothetical protein
VEQCSSALGEPAAAALPSNDMSLRSSKLQTSLSLMTTWCNIALIANIFLALGKNKYGLKTLKNSDFGLDDEPLCI